MGRILFLIVLWMVTGAQVSQAEVAKNITWDDLLPPLAPLEDPLAALPLQQRYDMGFVANVRHLIELGQVPEGDPAIDDAEEVAKELTEKGVDVAHYTNLYRGYAKELTKRDQLLNETLNGKDIRMPGYLLPLEYEGVTVSTFLLVPYVGACIHTPPPPPNQIVHVKMNQSFVPDDMFMPVWITGKLHAEHSKQSLSFVDGSADIPVGYRINATDIAPYEQ